jgi:hypothetical protein
MSDGEGSTHSTTTAVVETGGPPDNLTITAGVVDGQQNVTQTKDDGEPNPKKAKISSGGTDGLGRGGGIGSDKQQTASVKLEHRLGGILCCAVCLDLPRSVVYQVRFLELHYHYNIPVTRTIRWTAAGSILK